MVTRSRKSKKNGQSLVEYALLLSLVGVVVLSILGILGLAVTRGYAQVDAALGAKKNTAANAGNTYNIAFTTLQCGYTQSSQSIILSVGITGTGLTASSIRGYSEAGSEPVSAGGPQYQILQTILGGLPPDSASANFCPRTIVVQTDLAHGGLTIESPVLVQDFTAYP